MKMTLFVFALAALLALASCSKKEDAPSVPTTTVDVPAVTTTVAPVPTTEAPPLENKYLVDASQAFCKPEGAKFNCGNPVWYGFKGCKPDSDGDRQAEGTMYMKSLADIEAMIKVHGATVNVKMKDGTVKHYGVGFSADCVEL